ncbi:LPS assembly lipoprotein LptE [Legionella rowbothamii]|uniref:LPS-assembly lipoprotein LptE n=1 Tax=Legionella rowbothamii TaxID=96229 RepID=UPI001F5F5B1B|nr:LPS assembly lipoprotein LptE [Legionella rowbothamii]
MKKLFIPLMLSLLLCACGFHLRGMMNVPTWLNDIAIVAKEQDKELISILQAQLEGYNIHVESDPALAKYWLIINRELISRQIVSVGASTNPRQFTVTLLIEFMLQTRKGKILKVPKQVQVTRQITINNDRILGSTDEETILISEMKQDAAIQLLNQLSHRDVEINTNGIQPVN